MSNSSQSSVPTIDLTSHLPFRVAVLSNLIKQSSTDRFIKRSGMKDRDWRVLVIINSLEQCTPMDIVEKTGMDKATVTRAIQHLQLLKMLARTPNKKDGRSVVLKLRPEGQEQINKLLPLMISNGDLYRSVLTEGEYQLFLEIIDKLLSQALWLNTQPELTHIDKTNS